VAGVAEAVDAAGTTDSADAARAAGFDDLAGADADGLA
jgi:hypothetical protein